MRFVLYNQNSSAQELLHELGHALLNWAMNMVMSFYACALSRGFSSKHFFSPYHEDWERIGKIVQKKPQYKSGGLGYAKGVYHGFEACLMRSLDEDSVLFVFIILFLI